MEAVLKTCSNHGIPVASKTGEMVIAEYSSDAATRNHQSWRRRTGADVSSFLLFAYCGAITDVKRCIYY